VSGRGATPSGPGLCGKLVTRLLPCLIHSSSSKVGEKATSRLKALQSRKIQSPTETVWKIRISVKLQPDESVNPLPTNF
jgi:hypothetical protein